MNHLQTIRVACLLALIFAAGVLTGRFTAPNKPHYIPINPGGRVQTAEDVLARFKIQFKLTADQEQKFRPLLQDLNTELQSHPVLSQERLEIFRKYIPRMKILLQPSQHEALDRYSRDLERRFETARLRRGGN